MIKNAERGYQICRDKSAITNNPLTLAERRLQICNNKRFSNPRGEDITSLSRIHRGDKKTVANGSAMWYIVKDSQSDC